MDPARFAVAPSPSRARVHLSKESMAFAARLDAAEAAVRRQDYRAAVHLLHRAPSLLQGTGDGRVLELMALCASRSTMPSSGDPWALWHRCLAAYQDSQDARGMERAHRAVGVWAYGRGELEMAAAELHRAQRLLERQHRPEACIEGLCVQAEVAMARGRDAIDDGFAWANEAVVQSQNMGDHAFLEARSRLLRARACCLLGSVSDAALDMLWAERVAAPQLTQNRGQMSYEAVRVVMCRAETLLILGHPRRAATCLGSLERPLLALAPPSMVAHYRLLVAQAYLSDQPHAAHDAGVEAQHFFAANRQPYFRAASEIALLRTAQRLSHKDTSSRLRALLALKLGRWPLLAFALERAQEDVRAPQHQALGAVRTPWMRAVGKIDLRHPKDKTSPQPRDEHEHAGFMARLGHALSGHDHDLHHTLPEEKSIGRD